MTACDDVPACSTPAPMTIAIASFQRREKLLRLMKGLDAQLSTDDELRRDVSIVVVLDGSTDGSRDAMQAETWSVPVRVLWQPNRGLAAARNAGLAAATGGVVWFLDDDVVPSAGLVERHRRAHRCGDRTIVVGPCRVPPDADGPPEVRQWWAEFEQRLCDEAIIERYDRFTAANASGPAAMFGDVGGFDERLSSYGLEDYELAVRLLAAGVPIRVDHEAVAWHPDLESVATHIARERGIGENAARIVEWHPHTAALLFPDRPASPSRQLLRRLHLRRPGPLMVVSRAALTASRLMSWLPGPARRARHLAGTAAYAAGVSSVDRSGTLLERVLGDNSEPSRRWRGSSRRASRHPRRRPTSNDVTISR